MGKYHKLFLVLSLFFLTGCSTVKHEVVNNDLGINKKAGEKAGKNMTVQKNSTVKVHYVGTFDDGTVFDSSKNSQPLEFVVGSGQVIPGFEKAVEGMKVDEEKDVKIKADEAYGERNEQLVRDFPKNIFPKEVEAKAGSIVTLQSKEGLPIPATVKAVGAENVTIDLNHPLAGKDLNFNIKVVEVK